MTQHSDFWTVYAQTVAARATWLDDQSSDAVMSAAMPCYAKGCAALGQIKSPDADALEHKLKLLAAINSDQVRAGPFLDDRLGVLIRSIMKDYEFLFRIRS